MPETSSPSRGTFALDHMELYVRDLEAMQAFYTDVLGFTVTDEGGSGEDRMIFLSRDPGTHHQLVLGAGRPDSDHFNIINHISFRVDALPTLRTLWRKVATDPKAAAQPVEQANHGISWSLYFRDPEGNRLECFVDSPWYTPQPFRVPLDFDLPDEEIERLTERLCRERPGFATRAAWLNDFAARFAADAQ